MNGYVVIDLEMCDVPKERRESYDYCRELIQIGAVYMDASLNITDSFMTYVKPQFGEISSFIERLTGISAADVSDAPLFSDAIARLVSWMPEGATLVTWSDSDTHHIYQEMTAKSIDMPDIYPYLDEYIDCQLEFSDKLATDKIYRLSEALAIADIKYDPDMHDALVDARNTALLFAKIQSEDKLTLSPYFIPQSTEDSYTFDPFKKKKI